ncbi:hypothetical protein [Klebsiella pneumoniae]|uniref:hypothetical protein n=1 Tax=Klebsiella pneumoniae TaxID=573 RepID=UPI001D12DAD9|nr:hypothetical protein [Klebsiella pneumoniae]
MSAAHQLVQRKETIRLLEASASREHFKNCGRTRMPAESGDIFQRVLGLPPRASPYRRRRLPGH